jgi:hypothetical protein
LRYSREWGAGWVSAGIGYEDPVIRTGYSSRVNGFLSWQQGF